MRGRSSAIRLFLAAMLAICGRPASSFGEQAQPSDPFATLKANQTIWVTTSDGLTTRGRLRGWADPAFEWDGPDGPRRVPLGAIDRVEAPDSIRNGLRAGAFGGAIAGGAFATLIAAGLSCTSDCGAGYSRTRDVLGGTIAGALVGAGIGAAAGATLDALMHRRRVVYARTGVSRVTFAPVVMSGRLGATTIVRW